MSRTCPALTQSRRQCPVPRIPIRICLFLSNSGRSDGYGKEGVTHHSVRGRRAMMGCEMTDHDTHCYELVADCRFARPPISSPYLGSRCTGGASHGTAPTPGPAGRDRRHQRKVLSDSLHRLLAGTLVERHAHAEAPPRIDYALTSLGQSLVEGPMMALGRWGSSTVTNFSSPGQSREKGCEQGLTWVIKQRSQTSTGVGGEADDAARDVSRRSVPLDRDVGQGGENTAVAGSGPG